MKAIDFIVLTVLALIGGAIAWLISKVWPVEPESIGAVLRSLACVAEGALVGTVGMKLWIKHVVAPRG